MVTAAILSMALVGQTPATKPAPPAAKPVLLNRKFVLGETNTYRMDALLTVELKEQGLETFLPSSTGYEYGFTTAVNKIDMDGNATMVYERGKTVRIDGEYAERPERRVAESEGFKFELIVSPINEFVGMKQIKDPPKPGAKPAPRNQTLRLLQEGGMSGTQMTDALVGQFISDLYRLSLFVGSLDSSFDFNPKLPEDPIKVGDTWKTTMSYQPQRLAGTNRQVVQRLDMTYKYVGPATVNGKKVERITADLGLDNDMVSYVNQTYGIPPAQSPFRALRMQFDSKIVFNLDPVNFKTLSAQALSKGSIRLEMKSETAPIAERRIHGESNFRLVGSKVVPPKPAPRPAAGGNRPR